MPGEPFTKRSASHERLAKLAGDWEGIAKTWFGPGEPADESPVSGTMELILDGRFILHRYKGKFGDKPLEGMAIIGYHKGLEKFQCAWVDSFHNDTAIMFSEAQNGTTDLNMLGSYAYVAPGIEQYWGWRTEINIVSDSEVIFTAYNISPEGDSAKATETIYRKKS